MKYSWEFKLECVNKYKNGEYIATPGKTRNQRITFMHHVKGWVKIYNDLGTNGLKHSSTNKNWTPEKRFELVDK
ncbi:MAG: IS3 family transposase, partial [Bacilli bacterium]|nr:IS3 family transposase [Bacilli bacterium]